MRERGAEGQESEREGERERGRMRRRDGKRVKNDGFSD